MPGSRREVRRARRSRRHPTSPAGGSVCGSDGVGHRPEPLETAGELGIGPRHGPPRAAVASPSSTADTSSSASMSGGGGSVMAQGSDDLRWGGRFPASAERPLEAAACAGDPAADRARRDAQRLGDLGVVHADQVAEHQRRTELLGELGQGHVEVELVAHLLVDVDGRSRRSWSTPTRAPRSRVRGVLGRVDACVVGARRGMRWWPRGRPRW